VSVLRIERVDVGPEQVEALVRVTDREFATTSAAPGLPGRALELLPGLAKHSCINSSSHGHIAELADTETPHLLEHVACELMALSGSPRTLRAETAWDFAADGPGVFRVRLAYDHDLAALGALRNGVEVVEWLLGASADQPDVERIVTELVAVRGRDS
jgi:hypothetical protein